MAFHPTELQELRHRPGPACVVLSLPACVNTQSRRQSTRVSTSAPISARRCGARAASTRRSRPVAHRRRAAERLGAL